MLKLVGHAFEYLEDTVAHELYHKNPCPLWSDWTNCTSKVRDSFGYHTRVRTSGDVTIETASKVCEGQCTSNYTITKHGFCLKSHNSSAGEPHDERTCQSEGGHLINADTKERVMDIAEIAKTNQYTWVDGIIPTMKE